MADKERKKAFEINPKLAAMLEGLKSNKGWDENLPLLFVIRELEKELNSNNVSEELVPKLSSLFGEIVSSDVHNNTDTILKRVTADITTLAETLQISALEQIVNVSINLLHRRMEEYPPELLYGNLRASRIALLKSFYDLPLANRHQALALLAVANTNTDEDINDE